MASSGYLYVLTNPAMPGMVKIGLTKGKVEHRAKQLSSGTALPEAFDVFTAIPVSDVVAAERQAHGALDAFRVNRHREFFRISPVKAVEIVLHAIAQKTDYQRHADDARKARVESAAQTMNRNRLYTVAKRRNANPEFLKRLLSKFDKKHGWDT